MKLFMFSIILSLGILVVTEPPVLLYSDGTVINRIDCKPNLTCWVDGGTLHISRAGLLVEPDLKHKVTDDGTDYDLWECPSNSIGIQAQNASYDDDGGAKPVCITQ